MTDERTEDRMQSDHERKVAEIEREPGDVHAEDDPTRDPGRESASDDTDVVGDQETSPGQNSDRLPQ